MGTTASSSRARERPDKARVLTTAMLRAGNRLGLNGGQLAEVIGRSESSVSRMASGAATLRLEAKEAELAALLVRCYRSLDALVGGNDEQRRAWMKAYNRALGGRPCELMVRAQGLTKTAEYLDRMRAPS